MDHHIRQVGRGFAEGPALPVQRLDDLSAAFDPDAMAVIHAVQHQQHILPLPFRVFRRNIGILEILHISRHGVLGLFGIHQLQILIIKPIV
ncbi:hypothetical protein D3C76_1318220 [compost metagenome]